jgi:hypothetical protein
MSQPHPVSAVVPRDLSKIVGTHDVVVTNASSDSFDQGRLACACSANQKQDLLSFHRVARQGVCKAGQDIAPRVVIGYGFLQELFPPLALTVAVVLGWDTVRREILWPVTIDKAVTGPLETQHTVEKNDTRDPAIRLGEYNFGLAIRAKALIEFPLKVAS